MLITITKKSSWMESAYNKQRTVKKLVDVYVGEVSVNTAHFGPSVQAAIKRDAEQFRKITDLSARLALL